MLALFVYFLIFLIPGLFAVLVYNRFSRNRVECCNALSLAFIFDWLIVGINFAVLYLIKGICSFQKLNSCLNSLRFTSKYILLSIVVGIILAILACLLTRLFSRCRKHIGGGNNNCN